MAKSRSVFELFAGFGGFAGVLMGALAAHKAQDAYAEGLLRQASLYCILHSLAILTLAGRPQKAARIACGLFTVGIVLFCGALCVKVFVGPTFIAHLVPGGGTCLMLGWLAVAAMALTKNTDQAT